jgi:hypothetical protein
MKLWIMLLPSTKQNFCMLGLIEVEEKKVISGCQKTLVG